jgi:hypothetical protein
MSLKARLDRLELRADRRPAWVVHVVWAEDEPPDTPPGSLRIALHWEWPAR